MTPWIIWGLALLVILAFLFLLTRRQRVRRFSVDRTPAHEAKVTAVTEWLGVGKVRSAIREFEGASYETLDGLRDIIGRMDEKSVDHVLYERILKFRQVRQVVASHITREHGVSRRDAMKALLEWAGKKEAA